MVWVLMFSTDFGAPASKSGVQKKLKMHPDQVLLWSKTGDCEASQNLIVFSGAFLKRRLLIFPCFVRDFSRPAGATGLHDVWGDVFAGVLSHDF